MTASKICGLMTLADVAAVNAARPEYAGFVFAGGRHHVTLDTALELRHALDPHIQTVGVFMDNPCTDIITAIQAGAISVAQLHGNEPETAVATIHASGAQVMLVFRPGARRIVPTAADFIMLDGGAGSGQLLDWTALPNAFAQPLFLAGGLTPTNVAAAIHAVHPTVVDVSSGVETDGHKDAAKINAFIATAHHSN